MLKKTVGIPLFSDAEKGRRVLTLKERRAFQKGIREAQELREAREAETRRRRTMAIEFETGQHCHCGGSIIFKSTKTFVATGSVLFGGQQSGYYSETLRSFCDACGVFYDHGHSRFNKAHAELKKCRESPGEDWVPPAKKKGEK